MLVYNVCAKKEYVKDGEMKVKFNKVGILKIKENGAMFLSFFHLPNIEYYLLKSKPIPIIQLEEQ
jgi:hypothetical protein